MVPAVKHSITSVSGADTLVPAGTGELVAVTGELLRWKGENKRENKQKIKLFGTVRRRSVSRK